jgi:hypothetical protein
MTTSMHIQHVSGIEVPPLHIKEHEKRNAPPTLPYPPFLAGVFGSRGSGKTTSMIELLRLYDAVNAFDKIYIFSPTTEKDPKFAALLESKPNAKIEFIPKYTDAKFQDITDEMDKDLKDYERFKVALAAFQKFDKGKSVAKLSPDELLSLYEYDFTNPKTGSKFLHGRPSRFIVFDDMVGDKQVYRNDSAGLVGRFAFRHRHYNASMCFMAQTYASGVPRQIRNNLSTAIFFANKSDKMKTEIAEEMSSFVSVDEFVYMWNYATEKDHGFLMVDFSAVHPSHRFRSGFDDLIVLSSSRDKDEETQVRHTPRAHGRVRPEDVEEEIDPKDTRKASKTCLGGKPTFKRPPKRHPKTPSALYGTTGGRTATVPGAFTRAGGANTTNRRRDRE